MAADGAVIQVIQSYNVFAHINDLVAQGRYNEAVSICKERLSLNPKDQTAIYGTALILFKLKLFDQSLKWVNAAISCDDAMVEALVLRARILKALGDFEGALESSKKAVQTKSGSPDAWHCLGFVNMALGRWGEAKVALGKASELAPSNLIIRSQYALALNENNEVEAAYKVIHDVCLKFPDDKEVLMIQSTILASAGYYDLAGKIREKAGAEDFFAKAEESFLTGSFALGLRLISERNEKRNNGLKDIPRWNGVADKSLHLVVTGEQGYGDIIQFARYITVLHGMVGKVSLRIPHHLARLFKNSMPSLSLITYKDPDKDIDELEDGKNISDQLPDDIKARCSLMDIPLYLASGFDFMIDAVPYLRADPVMSEKWRGLLDSVPYPRVGIVWAGNRRHTNDHKRSLSTYELSPIIDRFGKHLISMQVGKEGKINGIAIDATPFIKDFADSAALLNEIDLLITIDSAPAHLAGALGKPVWTLLPFSPDWRWLLGREDSIWYPAMRLFRQKHPGAWGGVVKRIYDDLERLISGDQSVLKPTSWPGTVLKRNPDALPLQHVENIDS